MDDELARWALSGWKMWEPGPDGWGEMNEFLEASLKDRMELVCRDTEGDPLHWTDQGFTRAIHALCARMGIDPFALWLDSLPPWDGVYRLGLLFISALGAADTDVNREAARLFLAAAVQRTWRPGVKHDWMPVLVSDKQGSGKSTLVSLLMPPGREKEWYSGCGRLNDTTPADTGIGGRRRDSGVRGTAAQLREFFQVIPFPPDGHLPSALCPQGQ